jgi:hypothetical protein
MTIDRRVLLFVVFSLIAIAISMTPLTIAWSSRTQCWIDDEIIAAPVAWDT